MRSTIETYLCPAAEPQSGVSPSMGDTTRRLIVQQKPLTWEFLKKVGAGFWLTDAAVIRSVAEALAKAQFAVRRDPHDCALIYIALGKKGTLQVRRC